MRCDWSSDLRVLNGTKVRRSEMYDSEVKLGSRNADWLNQVGWWSIGSPKRSVRGGWDGGWWW